MYLKEQKQSINNLLFVWEILNIKKKKNIQQKGPEVTESPWQPQV